MTNYIDELSPTGDDWTPAFQKALDAGAGGTVVIGRGTYLLRGTIYVHDGTTLCGQSRQTTNLFYAGTGAAIAPYNSRFGAPPVPGSTRSISVENLVLECTAAAKVGVDWYCVERSSLRNVRIINAGGTGLALGGFTGAGGDVPCQLNLFDTVECYHNGLNLAAVTRVNDNTAQSCCFINLDDTRPGNVLLGADVRNERFFGCFFYHAGAQILEVREAWNEFHGCTWEFSAGNGILLGPTSRGNLFVGGMAVRSNIVGQRVVDQGAANCFWGLDDGMNTASVKDFVLPGGAQVIRGSW